jgi:hypothetical protein
MLIRHYLPEARMPMHVLLLAPYFAIVLAVAVAAGCYSNRTPPPRRGFTV